MTKHQVTNTLRNPLLVIVGPTASGKTEIACEVSKRLPVEMVSCDSMQVYRKMPIITQTPPRSVTRKLRAHLVSFLDPSKEYNAALFRQNALSSIHKILANGKTPLIVGGTGLYLRALLDGLFESKDSGILKDEELRETLMNEQKTHGGYFLHARLERVDPISAKKIHPHDLRRIVRALEVFHLTGKPLSAQAANRKGIRAEYFHKIFLLNRNRTDLYERINTRVDQMLKIGLLKEVKRLGSLRLGLPGPTAPPVTSENAC